MKEINYKSETIKLSQSLNKKELRMWSSLCDLYRVAGKIKVPLSSLYGIAHLNAKAEESDIENMMDKLLTIKIFVKNPMKFSGFISGHLVDASKEELVSETGKRYVYYYIEKVFNPDILYEGEISCATAQ